jgi:signal transduction histidine kinase
VIRRLNGPAGACGAFLFVAALVAGGLGWVTHAALDVEASRIEADNRAERSNKERLALWRLDGQMLFALGLENNRPFAHYSPLHATYSAIDTGANGLELGVARNPSPLLSTDVQPWMLLHFQIDPETGWESPQVLETELAERLQNPPLNWSTANCTDARRERLAELEAKFPAHELIPTLTESERTFADETPFAVQFPRFDEAAAAKRSGGATARYVPAPAGRDDTVAVERPVRHPPVQTAAAGVIPVQPEAKANRPGKTTRGPVPVPPPAAVLPAPAAAVPTAADPNFGPFSNPAAQAQTAPDPRPTPATGPQTANRTTATNPGWYSNKYLQNDLQQREDQAKLVEFNGRMQLAQRVFEGRGSYEAQQFSGKPGGGYLSNNDKQQADGKNDAKTPDPARPGLTLTVTGGKVTVVGPAPEYDSLAKVEKAKDAVEALRKSDHDADLARQLTAALDEAVARYRGESRDAVQKNSAQDTEPGATRDRRFSGPVNDLPLGSAKRSPLGDDRLKSAPKPGETVVPVPAGVRKPGPGFRAVPVQVGPLRPRWLTAADGTEVLVLVRAATVDDKTVYQGVLLDWPGLRGELGKKVSDLFPDATLTPVRNAEELVPERAMTALPVQLDPGPLPPPVAAGWTPLRLGLALAWAAALVALVAVGVGGWSLLKLSERRIRFVSAVTHELRTPLTSMRLYLDLLTSGMIRDEEKQKEYLNTLAAESARLNQLVENVLDFAKLEKRSVMACRQATPVADLVGQVRDTWFDRCAAEGKELVVVATVPAGQTVHTDVRIAAQIVGNLVDNARKYARDAADPRIWVWAKPGQRGRVIFEVEDRGPGVPPRERGSIFRAFRRGKESNAHTGGAGLGLALAKQWADMLGGTLSYRPADGGVGACFRLELPGA